MSKIRLLHLVRAMLFPLMVESRRVSGLMQKRSKRTPKKPKLLNNNLLL